MGGRNVAFLGAIASLPPSLQSWLVASLTVSHPSIYNKRQSLFSSSNSVRALGYNLERTPGDADFIKKFSLATWITDADAAVNVVLMIPELECLSLCIDMKFTPDHLRRLSHKPMPNLRYLSLRCRPFESKVIYNPSDDRPAHTYYDSVLETLASWPSAELPVISVVEDLVGRRENVRFLRPSRWRLVLPRITFLDLSNCCLSDLDVSKLLHSLPRLCHLVLDRCNLLDDAHTRDWAVFGHHCMLERKDLNLERLGNRRLGALGGASGTGGSHPREVRILPRVSALRTLSLSVPAHVDADARRVLLAEFRRGWAEAVAMFNGIVSAGRRSRTEEGVVTYRFPWPGEVGNALPVREYSFIGMMVVDDNDEFSQLSEVKGAERCPVVCLAGQSGREEGIEHAEGCGHSIGWDIWEDNL
ncbi:hypothetical protein EDB86DRAFT_3085686 [Lactarius hatsudake]|nr:hypothetical protein EDB86DRAFT_3085686 [Lactarius hatsudake]